jgi:hypothetical protein
MKTPGAIRYLISSLLLGFGLCVGMGQAQENVESPAAPVTAGGAPSCSKVPTPQSNSDEYNDGYRAGFKDGCNIAGKMQITAKSRTPLYGIDEAVNHDVPVPVSYKRENTELLDALKSTCPPVADKAVKDGKGQNESWNLKYRISLLTSLVSGAECPHE